MRLSFPQGLKRLTRRVADSVPSTWRGTFIALFSALALWRYGYGTLDLLLFVVGVAGLALAVLSSIATAAAAFHLRRRIEASVPASSSLEAGSLIPTGFQVPALGAVPLVKIAWQWLEPEDVEVKIRRRGHTLHEEVVARGRGLVPAIRRRFTVGDAFGLAAVSWHRTDPGQLTILPDVGLLKNMPVIQPMAAAEGLPHPMGAPEGDRMEIRRYVPGDSVRNILWKTFARTRQLNVRTPERSIDRSRKTVAYLLTGNGDEAAAAAARVAIESESLGAGWLFGADGTAEPAESLEAALAAIARSRSFRHDVCRNGSSGGPRGAGDSRGDGVRGSRTAGLAAFLGRHGVHGETHCIVFAPAHPGAWTGDALAATRNFSGAVSFVLGTDGISRRGPTPLWRRFLFLDEETTGVTTDELAEIMQVFSRSGSPALVVDRASGRAFSGHGGRGLGAVR